MISALSWCPSKIEGAMSPPPSANVKSATVYSTAGRKDGGGGSIAAGMSPATLYVQPAENTRTSTPPTARALCHRAREGAAPCPVWLEPRRRDSTRYPHHVLADQVARHETNPREDEIDTAGVELEAAADRGEIVEPQHAGLVSEIGGIGELQDVAQRLAQRGEVEDRLPPPRPEAERLGVHGSFRGAGRIAETLQPDVRVAQLHVDLIRLAVALDIEDGGTAEAVRVQPAAVEKVELAVGLEPDQPSRDGGIGCHVAEREVEDRPQLDEVEER